MAKNERGWVLGCCPTYLGCASLKMGLPCKKRFLTKHQSGLESDVKFRRYDKLWLNCEAYGLITDLNLRAGGYLG